jgi:hypothetical protein
MQIIARKVETRPKVKGSASLGETATGVLISIGRLTAGD